MRYLIPILLCLLMACGEDAPDCLTATGSTVNIERQLAPYSEVNISDNIDVHLTSDKGSTVKIEAGENIISKIITEVEGGVLHVKNENSCNWVRSAKREIKVTIPVRDATFVIHYGAGELNTLGALMHDSITIRQYGGGDAKLDVYSEYLNVSNGNVCTMTVSGEVTHLVLLHNSIGKTDASRLKNRFAYAENMNYGEVIVSTTDYLFFQIFDQGDIRMTQLPDSIKNVGKNGPGKLIYP